MNLEKLINAAMRSPLGTLVLVVIALYLLTVILGMCGCSTPRCVGPRAQKSTQSVEPHADGPDTTQKFDRHGYPNFGER